MSLALPRPIVILDFNIATRGGKLNKNNFIFDTFFLHLIAGRADVSVSLTPLETTKREGAVSFFFLFLMNKNVVAGIGRPLTSACWVNASN